MFSTKAQYLEGIVTLSQRLKLGKHAATAAEANLPFESPEQYAYDFLAYIEQSRKQEAARKNAQQAGFLKNPRYTLDLFEFSDKVEIPNKFGKEWLTECKFIDEHQNLVLLGNAGTGKTHFATALGKEACRRGYRVMFRETASLIDELCRTYEKGLMPRFKAKLNKVDLLILDEWGYLPVNQLGTNLLFDVIANCYETRSIILTTNLPLKEWNRIFADERLINAVIDRLVHHGLLITHRGESYRKTHSLMLQ